MMKASKLAAAASLAVVSLAGIAAADTTPKTGCDGIAMHEVTYWPLGIGSSASPRRCNGETCRHDGWLYYPIPDATLQPARPAVVYLPGTTRTAASRASWPSGS